ncbi:hypothetical protein GGI07_005076 [Coemansia sp. Benny D115]|nr:hypothetical protein GGI07_005076 [Coemansia sp. Benny D115]
MLSGSSGHDAPPPRNAPPAQPALPRRRSASDLTQPPNDPEPASSGADEWLSDELEAVGELKRGAIAARFPDEFSLDSEFLNDANVWLPARLHPEIAPGEFQEWLKRHSSQLSRMEDSVNRRKSILSYSYKSIEDGPSQPGSAQDKALQQQQQREALRRRNTTGLVRRKSFIERAAEEPGDAPFLVQSVQRSSLKRSKLANKRRDSTASSQGAAPSGRRRRGRTQLEVSAPSVSSPLAPPGADDDDDDATPGQQSMDEALSPSMSQHSRRDPASDAHEDPIQAAPRMSTAEILRQVTAAVDDMGFDDFDLCEADAQDEPATQQHQQKQQKGRERVEGADALTSQPLPSQQQQQQQASAQDSQASERRTITHKKSGSWWQWGRDDSSNVQQGSADQPERDRKQSPSPPNSNPPIVHQAATAPVTSAQTPQAPEVSATPSLKAKLPSPISFLRFNRKSKKERKSTDETLTQQQQQQPHGGRAPSPSPAQIISGRTPVSQSAPRQQQQQQQQQYGEGDNGSDVSSDTESARSGNGQRLSGGGVGQQHGIPSIITPVRPPPTPRTGGTNNRLPIHIERAIYRLASIKLANPRRPLLQQVLLSNMMFWYLELINPRSQQQQAQQQAQQQQQVPVQQPVQQHMHQQVAEQPQAKQKQQKQPDYQYQQQQQQQPTARAASPTNNHGKRSNHSHKNNHRDGGNRRRSSGGGGGAATGERVVMRSPQYERQQQQIYMNGGAGGYSPQQQQQQQQYTPQSPHQQSMSRGHGHHQRSQQHQHQQQQSDLDEDDDVPLALYRGDRNAMSIG